MADQRTVPRRIVVVGDDRHARKLLKAGTIEYPITVGPQALKLGYNVDYVDTVDAEALERVLARCNVEQIPCPCGVAL